MVGVKGLKGISNRFFLFILVYVAPYLMKIRSEFYISYAFVCAYAGHILP